MKYTVNDEHLSGKRYAYQVDLSDMVSKNFSMDETINKSCLSPVKAVFTAESRIFLKLRQQFRDDYYRRYGRGMRCTSCYRDPVYNRDVAKGTSNSLHLKMLAADLETGQPLTDSVWAWCIEECKKLQKEYNTIMELGRYSNPDRIHIGMGVTYSKTLYTFDKRSSK